MSSPPSVNRVLGIWWLGNLLYPELYDYDMVQVAQEYYRLFWHYDPIRGGEPARKKCNIRLRRLTLWMLACLTTVCLRREGRRSRRSRISRRIPQSLKSPASAASPPPEGQTPAPAAVNPMDRPPQGGTTISDGNRRVLEGWAAQTGGITGGPRRRRCAVSQKKRGTNK